MNERLQQEVMLLQKQKPTEKKPHDIFYCSKGHVLQEHSGKVLEYKSGKARCNVCRNTILNLENPSYVWQRCRQCQYDLC